MTTLFWPRNEAPQNAREISLEEAREIMNREGCPEQKRDRLLANIAVDGKVLITEQSNP